MHYIGNNSNRQGAENQNRKTTRRVEDRLIPKSAMSHNAQKQKSSVAQSKQEKRKPLEQSGFFIGASMMI